ncbi:Calcium-dependent protein kinase [Trebouxia sp. C0010 RCD-2024]
MEAAKMAISCWQFTAVIVSQVFPESLHQSSVRSPSWPMGQAVFWMQTALSEAGAGAHSLLLHAEEDWAHVSDFAKDSVRKLLTSSKADRMTPSQFLEHEWVTNELSASQPALPPAVIERLRKVAVTLMCRRCSAVQ